MIDITVEMLVQGLSPDVQHRAREIDAKVRMRTCSCSDRTGIIQNRPSGLALCKDCGLLLPVQPPPPKERP